MSVGTHVGGLNWDEPDLFPVLEAAEQSNALVFVHPAASRLKDALPRYHMRNFIANPTETTIAIGSLIFGGILDRLPGLRLLFAHGGGYACWAYARFDHGHQVRPEAREHIARLPSDYLSALWYDSLVHGYGNLRRLIDVVGLDRVVLGTDFPADMGQPDPVAWIDGSDLSDSGEGRGARLERGGDARMVKDPSIETVMPAGAARLRELFQRLDPNFAKLSSAHLSRLLSRPGLDARTRLLVLTGQYAITGRHDQLGETIEAALDAGVRPSDLLEVILQCYVYTGPWVVAAAGQVYLRVLERRPDIEDDLSARVDDGVDPQPGGGTRHLE